MKLKHLMMLALVVLLSAGLCACKNSSKDSDKEKDENTEQADEIANKIKKDEKIKDKDIKFMIEYITKGQEAAEKGIAKAKDQKAVESFKKEWTKDYPHYTKFLQYLDTHRDDVDVKEVEALLQQQEELQKTIASITE